MPRRPKPKKQNKRYKPKNMKRPRHWHKKGKPLWLIWLALQRDKERMKDRIDERMEAREKSAAGR